MTHRFAPNRRTFLSAMLATGGALTIRPACLQADDARKPLSFILVSDTHLGYRDQESAAKQWQKTAAEISQAEGELVLHLGDVVDGGRESQYPIYLAAKEKIGKPVYEIPGNHDPADLFAKHLRAEVDTTVDLHWLRFLLLNNARTDSHDGFLSEEQTAWIDQQCVKAAEENKLVAICMHVPAHANRHPDRGWYVKPDQGQTALYEIIKQRAGQIVGMFHGHFHNGLRGWNDHGPHEICFPSVLYNLNRKLEEQQAPGYNPLEFRPGYTLATVANGAITFTYKPLQAEPSITQRCAWGKQG